VVAQELARHKNLRTTQGYLHARRARVLAEGCLARPEPAQGARFRRYSLIWVRPRSRTPLATWRGHGSARDRDPAAASIMARTRKRAAHVKAAQLRVLQRAKP
jgi:hypothetical protein